MTPVPVAALREQAEGELERALRGASLCAVSRDPSAGASSVKFLEGRWYTLRDLERHLERGSTLEEALDAVTAQIDQRTPAGPAWEDYRAGALAALADVRG